MSQHNPGPLLSFPKNLSQESCQPQACPADALEWDISSQERRVAGSPQEAGARDTSAWSRVLASPFLRAAHSPPLSPRRFGHGQGTQAKPGQAGPEAAAWQQPVPVSAGTRGGGCDGGTWLQLGTVPHLAPLPPPALHHSPSNYSSCLPTVVGMGLWDVPAPWGSQEHHLTSAVVAGVLAGSRLVCVADGVWRSPFPIRRCWEKSLWSLWSPHLLQISMLVAVLAFKCCSLGDRHPCRGT